VKVKLEPDPLDKVGTGSVSCLHGVLCLVLWWLCWQCAGSSHSTFDVGSYFGGMATMLALIFIGFIIMKICRQRRVVVPPSYATF